MSDQIMIHGDFADVSKDMVSGTVDLIYTDPPYKRELATPTFALLALHAPRLLKRGGSLVTITPHYFLEDAMLMFWQSLKFRWIYCMDQEDGPHPRMAMGVEVLWKPLLHYVKDAYPQGRGFLKDKTIIPGPDKTLHDWQQSEAWAEYYIEKLTEPGDLVLDPFCGPGTVPAVCKKLGRRAIGVEIDEGVYEDGKKRIANTPQRLHLL